MAKDGNNGRGRGRKKDVQSSLHMLALHPPSLRHPGFIGVHDSYAGLVLPGCPNQSRGVTHGSLSRAFDHLTHKTTGLSESHATRRGPVTHCSVYTPFGWDYTFWVRSTPVHGGCW